MSTNQILSEPKSCKNCREIIIFVKEPDIGNTMTNQGYWIHAASRNENNIYCALPHPSQVLAKAKPADLLEA